ncbi:MAG: DUF354 domain-containing protein [Bacteroidales bacterium]|nr:DUF354 domain-containing protein [Bacteroidales bacterium]
MKIWIDITNTPHVHVLLPILGHLQKEHEIFITARDFSETIPLLSQNNISPIIIGNYKGKSRVKKVFGLVTRMFELRKKIPEFDLSLSLGGNYTATISRLRKKPSVIMSDNDISFKAPAYKFGSFFVLPEYFNTSRIEKRYGIKKQQIFTYNGFKEEIYIAGYVPDNNFPALLPFDNYITIRPENLKASYVPKNSTTIVPELFEALSAYNILYLPRYASERIYAQGHSNIYMPGGPLNGLDVCYYTKAMLTGAGTFAREAALLGRPAVSFFPGKTFLAVDTIMQERGWQFKSRNAGEIAEYVKTAANRPNQQLRSQQTLKEVLGIFDKILNTIG